MAPEDKRQAICKIPDYDTLVSWLARLSSDAPSSWEDVATTYNQRTQKNIKANTIRKSLADFRKLISEEKENANGPESITKAVKQKRAGPGLNSSKPKQLRLEEKSGDAEAEI